MNFKTFGRKTSGKYSSFFSQFSNKLGPSIYRGKLQKTKFNFLGLNLEKLHGNEEILIREKNDKLLSLILNLCLKKFWNSRNFMMFPRKKKRKYSSKYDKT